MTQEESMTVAQLETIILETAAMVNPGARPPTEHALGRFIHHLGSFTDQQIISGLEKVERECEFFTLKGLLDRIDDGRPSADEAWSLVRFDEDSTFVMTDEMSAALGVAYPIYFNDKIAARIAFKDKYNSELSNARANGKKTNWFVSWGSDKQAREMPLREAISLGRISHESVVRYLPTPDDGVISGLLSGKMSDNIPEGALKALALIDNQSTTEVSQ